MSFVNWIAFTGGLLLIMAFSSAYLRRLPVTSAVIYLAIGLAVGPAGWNLIRIDFIKEKVVIEHFTEIAVIVSLFVGGLKLRLPLTDPAWTAAFRLAGPVMLATIAGVAAFAHLILGLDWPVALLLGAVLAPTDPVLAGMVTVDNARDQNRVRYGLSGEAGFNDGAAFPFVIFSLMWIGQDQVASWAGSWALHRLAWAVPAGLLIGYLLGKCVGLLAIRLRSRHPTSGAPGDFLALALIAVSYSGAEVCGAWGFLAVFAAGLGFRRSELATVLDHLPAGQEAAGMAGNRDTHPPAEELAVRTDAAVESKHPTRAAGHIVAEITSFGETAERLLEMMLVLVLGICLPLHWDWRAVPVAIALFMIVRPFASLLFLCKSPTRLSQRLLIGWFGIRGAGSLYYLAYALNHGTTDRPEGIVGITLSVVALSVAVHGITTPLLDIYARRE